MKPVIFLDFDGVMCLATEWGGRFRKQKQWNKLYPENSVYLTNDFWKMDVQYRFDNFNKKAVRILNDILKQTDAEIVISSDWKYDCTLEEMQDLFKQYGVLKSPIDYTPSLTMEDFQGLELVKAEYEAERALEIKKWLALNSSVTKWVAIDDLNMTPHLDNFVHTIKQNEGIKQSGIKEKIISYLI